MQENPATFRFWIPCAIALVLNSTHLHLQGSEAFTDANWISFGGVPGADGPVNASIVDGAGNLYIGGDFNTVGSVVANHIAKWDGTNWSGLGSGLNGGVNALAFFAGNLYAGGDFTSAGSVVVSHIAKWDGTNWVALNSGTDSTVNALAASGSDLFVGGYFTTVSNSVGSAASVSRIARWDTLHWWPLGRGMNGVVNSLAVSGNTVYVGGSFTSATNSDGSTVSLNNVAKWDGSGWSSLNGGLVDTSFPWRSEVDALLVSGTVVYAGGYFNNLAGSNVAKWNGSSWSGVGGGCDGGVFALTISEGSLYAGGIFSTAGGLGANSIAKWNGSSWSALGSGTAAIIYTLAASGSNVFAGGSFLSAGGSAANNIARWDGNNWSSAAAGTGSSDVVEALGTDGSNLYAAGRFFFMGTTAASHIAKWNGNGWSALGSGISGPSIYGAVAVIAASGSDIYAGGNFTNAGGVAAGSVARWNGTNWTGLGSGVDNTVSALAVSGSNLYAGGKFTTATNVGGAPVPASHVARWDGSSWSPIGLGLDNSVYALAISGTNLFVGGFFVTASNVDASTITANSIAKWDGGHWSALGSGIGGSVRAMLVSGPNLYVGGFFTTAGGIGATNIARWDGSTWSALDIGLINPGDPYESSVAALASRGSDIYAAGRFTAAGGLPANYIAKWNGTAWAPLGSGLNDSATALAILGSGLYVGGQFTMAGGKVSPYIGHALLSGPSLSISRSGNNLTVSWPSRDSSGFKLEETAAPGSGTNWALNLGSVTDDGTNSSVIIPIAGDRLFFRLHSP